MDWMGCGTGMGGGFSNTTSLSTASTKTGNRITMAWDRKIKRWSLSAMKQFYKCPAQYAYQRFDKLETPPVPALEKGKKVHALGEAYIKGDITGVPKEYKDFETELKTLKKLGFTAEEKWAVTKSWEACEWTDWNNNWCLGMTDVHNFDKRTKHLDIIDFKTGRIYPDHVDGAEVYSALGTAYYPALKTVSVEFWYLDQGPSNVGASPFEYQRDDVEALKEKWERKAHRMLAAKKFDPKPSIFGCKFCNFRSDEALADGSMGPCEEWKRVL